MHSHLQVPMLKDFSLSGDRKLIYATLKNAFHFIFTEDRQINTYRQISTCSHEYALREILLSYARCFQEEFFRVLANYKPALKKNVYFEYSWSFSSIAVCIAVCLLTLSGDKRNKYNIKKQQQPYFKIFIKTVSLLLV